MHFQRSSGILLHPTCLPSGFGIGDLGPKAFEFIDFLASAGQRRWQVLPLSPTGFGDSPYQAESAFAGNILMISPDFLFEDGLVGRATLDDARRPDSASVDFAAVSRMKRGVLAEAFDSLKKAGALSIVADFAEFKQENSHWLDSFALFSVIKSRFGGGPWSQWPRTFQERGSAEVAGFEAEERDSVEAEKFFQFLFFRQWRRLKLRAAERGIRIIGDLPIFVAMDSSDVWNAPEDFKLDGEFRPSVVAGVPPDFFSPTGQLWGNPVYDWLKMRDDGFKWWVSRMRQSLELFDIVRLDHFRGFAANYEIPGSSETAENGHWVPVPGRDLFATLRWVFGDLPVIAEDLGFITEDVRELRREFGFPGMKILQYAWGGGPENEHLPHNFPRECVAYTGTHDNETLTGWLRDMEREAALSDEGRTRLRFCFDYLDADSGDACWKMIRALYASVAETVIVPFQDLLGAGPAARMNTPSTVGGNWTWRFLESELSEDLARRLELLSRTFGRC